MVDNSLILAIETATGCGSVALTRGDVRNGRLLAECTCQPEVSHSRKLLGSIQWVLAAAEIGWSDIDALAISIGPGSFTGLRIGLAAAKGIAMAADLPLIGVPTLDALALSCFLNDRLICCLLDARKQEVYAGFYRSDAHGELARIGNFLVLKPAELIARIKEAVVLVGPGAVLCKDYISDPDNFVLAPFSSVFPSAAKIGFLGSALLQQGCFLDPISCGPLYIRASEAEINLKSAG